MEVRYEEGLMETLEGGQGGALNQLVAEIEEQQEEALNKLVMETFAGENARFSDAVKREFSNAVKKAIGGGFPTQYKRAGRAR